MLYDYITVICVTNGSGKGYRDGGYGGYEPEPSQQIRLGGRGGFQGGFGGGGAGCDFSNQDLYAEVYNPLLSSLLSSLV